MARSDDAKAVVDEAERIVWAERSASLLVPPITAAVREGMLAALKTLTEQLVEFDKRLTALEEQRKPRRRWWRP